MKKTMQNLQQGEKDNDWPCEKFKLLDSSDERAVDTNTDQ
jgi:hypothetical protein